MNRLLFPTLVLAVLFLVPGALAAAPAPAAATEGADPLAIAAVLLRDGDLAKADQVLAGVDPRSRGVDLVRYHTLRGLAALKGGRAAEAEAAFLEARAQGQKDPNLDVLLAQAYFAQQKWTEVRQTLGHFPRLGAFADLLGMKAQAEWAQGDHADAFATLDRALQSFPKQTSFLQTRMAWLLDLGLDQEAGAAAQDFLGRAGTQPQAWLTVGESLRRAGALDQAVAVLEAARAAFPDQAKVRVSLGQTYLDRGLGKAAADLTQEAAALDPQWWGRAADLFRKAKVWDRALYCNSQVADLAAKTRQRFSILVDAGRYEEVLALVDRLDQLGLLDQGRQAYAAAYAAYRVQDFSRCRQLLARVTDPGVFGAAVQLRRAVEQAAAEPILYFPESP